MIPLNKDTLMMIATIVCAAGIIMLFRELNKTKDEMNTLRDVSTQMIKKLNTPTPEPAPEESPVEKTEE
jgi:uncharacterized membrane protein